MRMICLLTIIIVVTLINGCSTTSAKYLPDGISESELAVLAGGPASVFEIPSENPDETVRVFDVNIAEVYDMAGERRIKPSSWSGSYQSVSLPEGRYLIFGNCTSRGLYSPYQLEVELQKSKQYKIQCLVEGLKKSGFWTHCCPINRNKKGLNLNKLVQWKCEQTL